MGNNASLKKLRPEALADLTEATEFSESEIRNWYKDYIKDFPSGTLSVDQFKDVYIQHFPNGDATKFAEHVFRTFDKDNNHQLDFREFMIALSVTARGGPKDRLRWAFEMYDIDENGYITKEECTEIVKAIHGLRSGDVPSDANELSPEQRTRQIFERVDQDKDGVISEEEFIDGARMDENLVKLLQKDQFRY